MHIMELSHSYYMNSLDTRHFVIIECRHLNKGCGLKCGCIGWMLFRNLSCLGTIICSINTISLGYNYKIRPKKIATECLSR